MIRPCSPFGWQDDDDLLFQPFGHRPRPRPRRSFRTCPEGLRFPNFTR